MAVSFREATHGLLNAWREYMAVSVWQFNQVTGTGTDAPVSNPGNLVYVQPERELLGVALRRALTLALPELRFPHRPTFVTETYHLQSMRDLGRAAWPLRYAYVDAIGKRGVTIIQAGATVTYSDTDGDGVDDRATVIVSTTVTDPTEVRLYFRPADAGEGGTADDRFEIEPVTVTISGGTATITAHRALFVKPALWRQPYRSPNYNASSRNDLDTTDATAFVTAVDVVRVYPDLTGAVTINANPYPSYPSTPPVVMESAAGEAVIDNAMLGTVFVRLADNSTLNNRPCSVTIHYRAGYPLDPFTRRPDATLTTALLRLANSELPTALSLGEQSSIVWTNDDQKLTEVYLSQARFRNPFGTKLGAVAAWDVVQSIRVSYPVMAV